VENSDAEGRPNPIADCVSLTAPEVTFSTVGLAVVVVGLGCETTGIEPCDSQAGLVVDISRRLGETIEGRGGTCLGFRGEGRWGTGWGNQGASAEIFLVTIVSGSVVVVDEEDEDLPRDLGSILPTLNPIDNDRECFLSRFFCSRFFCS